jgi:putative nucleotidyltransferase with HDIG domain
MESTGKASMSTPSTSDITSKILSGEPFSFSFHYFSEKIILFINSLFAKILPRMDQVFLLDTSITILREICVNAVKANAKRVYFQKMKIDINDPARYTEGLQMFKKNIVGRFEDIEQDLNGSGYKVTFSMKKGERGLTIQISNNVPILPEELERINKRKELAKVYEDFSEAFDDIYDDSEGAGLGIVLISLLLKNSGIGIENYRITADEKATKTQLVIPNQLKPVAVITDIFSQIMEEVNGLPTFPENILELQRMCNDPDATIIEITEKILIDPALSSDVLKLSNSAGFVPGKRIENIPDAIKIIGLKNLHALLIATSARRILDKRYSKFEQIWIHCNMTAYYARKLAVKFKLSRIVENAFLSGLLHDLGKIVMLSTDVTLTNRIADIVKNRKMRTSTVMEEISIGISHARLGEMIARKWAFPEYLIESIAMHHSPLEATDAHRDLVYVTYLANMMCGIESRKYQYYYLETEVLEKLGITTEAQFAALHNELMQSYLEENR